MILVMSVQPGFGGQSFMPEVLDKIREIKNKKPDMLIQIDGGITAETAPLAGISAIMCLSGNFD